MRRSLAVYLLLFVLTFALCGRALAEEPSADLSTPTVPSESPVAESPVVTEPPVSESTAPEPPAATPTAIPIKSVFQTVNTTSYALPLLPVGSSPEDSKLGKAVLCETDGRELYDCPVLWDLSGVDFSAAGRKTVPGQLVPEDGYVLAFDGKVTCQLMVTAPGMAAEVLPSAAFYPKQNAYLLPVGGNLESLALSAETATCYTTHFGEYVTCPIAWEVSAVDVTTPGVYSLNGRPIPPDGFALPDDFVPLSLLVGVVAADCVDLSAVLSNGPEGQVICQWLYSPLDESTVALEVAVEDGAWMDAPPEGCGWLYGSYQNFNSQPKLIIFLPSLELYTDYYFRLRYDGGSLSNNLHIRKDSDDYVYTEGGKGGDRDGGDLGGNSLPDYIQPAPPPLIPQLPVPLPEQPTPPGDLDGNPLPDYVPPLPQQPTSPGDWHDKADSSAPATEAVTDTATTLSGTRMLQLTAAGDTVLFEKQGVAVDFPSDFLTHLVSAAHTQIEVSITRPGADSFGLELAVDGHAILDLPETVVHVPYDSGGDELLCVDAAGTAASEVISADGMARCVLTATGVYRLIAVPAPLPVAAPPADVSAAPATIARREAAPAEVSAVLPLLPELPSTSAPRQSDPAPLSEGTVPLESGVSIGLPVILTLLAIPAVLLTGIVFASRKRHG
ncbi:MAG: hypothetical protein RRY95_01035 [Oscillospiraceae bacterium]